MFITKVTFQETTRRFVVNEPCSYAELWEIVSKRFELPETATGSLKYTDPDGDLISLSTNDELKEALQLISNADPPLLRMQLVLDQKDTVAAPSSWCGALSDDKHANGDAESEDSVVVVDGEEEAAQDQAGSNAILPKELSEAEKKAAEEAEAKKIAEAEAKKIAEEEEERKRKEEEEERNRQAAIALAKQLEEEERMEEERKRKEEEELAERKRKEEEERKREEEAKRREAEEERMREEAARAAELERVRREEEERKRLEEMKRLEAEAARKKEEEERLRKEEEERLKREEEERQRLERLRQEEEERVRREEEERRVAEELRLKAAAEAEAEARRRAEEAAAAALAAEAAEAAAAAAEAAERQDRAEIALAAAEEELRMKAFHLYEMGCSLAQLSALFAPAILAQIQTPADAHVASFPASAAAAAGAAPVVNWAAARAEVEVPPAAVSAQEALAGGPEAPFPSPTQSARVAEVGDLAARLTAFYWEHNRVMVERVRDVVAEFGRTADGEERLNRQLQRKYGRDLTSLEMDSVAAEVVGRDAALVAEVEGVEVAAGSVVVVEEEEAPEVAAALVTLRGMGFSDEERLRVLLAANSNDVERVLNDLLQ